jgi:hypothetical protein
VFDGQRYRFQAAIIGAVISRETMTAGMRRSRRQRAAEILASRPDLESRLVRVELLARAQPGVAAFEGAIRLAREAHAAGATSACGRAIAAAQRAAGDAPDAAQATAIEELQELTKREGLAARPQEADLRAGTARR